MTSCHPIILPVKTSSTLFLNQANNNEQADLIVYQCLIGKLIDLNCETRLNIAFMVGQLKSMNKTPTYCQAGPTLFENDNYTEYQIGEWSYSSPVGQEVWRVKNGRVWKQELCR